MEWVMQNINFILSLIMLIFASINDFRSKTIKNIIPFSFMIIAIVLNMFTHSVNMFYSFIACILMFLFLFAVPRKLNIVDFMGAGDIKLYMVIALFMGWKFSFYCILYSGIVGSIILIIINYKRYYEIVMNVFFFLSKFGKWKINEESKKKDIFSPFILIGTITTYYIFIVLNNDWIFKAINDNLVYFIK